MASFTLSICLLVTILQVTLIRAGLKVHNIGCYRENKRDRLFKLSPGNYNPQGLTPEICSAKCGSYQWSYAAVTGGRFCFCGLKEPDTKFNESDHKQCSSKCTGDPSKFCGGPDHLNVYHTSKPIKAVTVQSLNTTVVKIGEPVVFQVVGEASFELHYQMEYGDGTTAVNKGSDQKKGTFVKTYAVPGQHDATATALDASGSLNKSSKAGVTVHAPVKDVSVECPEFVTASDKSCKVVISQGTNMTVFDTVDGKTRTTKVADPIVNMAGCCVSVKPEKEPEGQTDQGVYMMPASQFKHDGVVTHWELWATKAGSLKVMVLKPECKDYCYTSNTCDQNCRGVSCSNASFCPIRNTCDAGNKLCPVTNRYTSGAQNLKYVILDELELKVEKGYQLKESKAMKVNRGNIIAFENTDASIAFSKGKSNCDIKYDKGTSKFDPGSGKAVDDIRHHLRAIYSSETKIQLNYNFKKANKYKLMVNVSNMAFDHHVVKQKDIDVLEGIDAIVLSGPKYLALNEEAEFVIGPHTGGSSVKIDWDFGDDSEVANGTSEEKKKHSFSKIGVYNVSVSGWNSLATKRNQTTVVVEEKIKSFSVKYKPCVTLANCTFELTVEGGSNYEISWDFGDSTRNSTSEEDYKTSNIVTHVYSTGGNLSVVANCSNHVSSKVFRFSLPVQEVCTGLKLIREGSEKNVPFQIEWKLDHGSDCEFELTFNGKPVQIAKSDIANKRWASVQQVGLPANKYPVVLKVRNSIANYEIKVDFTIETAMRGVNSTCNATTIKNGETVSCKVTLIEGSNVKCTWDWDDGYNDTYDQGARDWQLRASTPEVRKHTFTVGKLHNVTVTCANNDKQVPQAHPVLVVQGVDDVTLQHERAVMLTKPAYAHFTFSTSGVPPNEATVAFNFGDTLSTTEKLKMDSNYTHEYRDPGCYTLNITFWNSISTKSFTDRSICVIEAVENFRIESEPKAAILNEPVLVKVIMKDGPTGKYANYTCDFADGKGEQKFSRQGKGKEGMDTRNITYTKLGQKTITCSVTTPLENKTVTYTMGTEQKISPDDCHISTNHPVKFGEEIQYSVQCDTNPMPTNAKITIDRGDGTTQTIDFSGKAGKPQIIKYKPKDPGHFEAKISFSNGGSSIKADLPAGSYKELKSKPDFTCQYKPVVPVNAAYKDGIEGINEAFPTSSPLVCTVDISQGTPVYYILTATSQNGGEAVLCNQTTNPIKCFIRKPGMYDVEVKVRNPLGDSPKISKELKMKEAVRGIHVKDLTPKAKMDEEKSFQISFDYVGDETCMNIDYGDDVGETFNFAGDETFCDRESSFDEGEFVTTLTNPMIVNRTFEENRNYEMKVTAVNLFSDATTTFTFSVSSEECDKPEVHIEDAMADFSSAVPYEKSQKVILKGKANITCKATLQNTKSWKVQTVDPLWGVTQKTTDITSDKAELVVEPRSLEYGLYKATYSIQMDLTDGTNFVESAFTFFKVTKSKLVVIMESGGISEVDRGYKQNVTFSPQKYSFDPDVARSDGQGFESFKWDCRLLKKVSDPGACDHLANTTGGSITFNTSIFKPDEKVELSCNVTKDSRFSIGKIIVNVVKGKPLNLYIEPVGSSRTKQLADAKMVSSKERLALQVVCKECEKGPLTCEWKAHKYEEGWPWKAYLPKEIESHITGLNKKTITVKASMYDIDKEVKKYRFSVRCRIGMGDWGRAALNIKLNPPPKPGVCTITPRNGTLSMENNSPFNVKCSKWTDETEIVEFKFYCTHKNTRLHHQITTFREADDVNIDPPLGAEDDEYREHMFVAVKDDMNAVFTYSLGIIQVFPPANAKLGDWTADQKKNTLKQIESVAATGDQKLVTEKLTKIASLLNSDKTHGKAGGSGTLGGGSFQPQAGAGGIGGGGFDGGFGFGDMDLGGIESFTADVDVTGLSENIPDFGGAEGGAGGGRGQGGRGGVRGGGGRGGAGGGRGPGGSFQSQGGTGQLGGGAQLGDGGFGIDGFDGMASFGAQPNLSGLIPANGITQQAGGRGRGPGREGGGGGKVNQGLPDAETGEGLVLETFKTESLGGLDLESDPEQQEALLLKAEEERDNKAALRDQIAGACANMTTRGETSAMEQVVTCLQTNAKEPSECSKYCQKATMFKTLEMTKELASMNTSSENTKTLSTALLNVAQTAAAAAVMNIQWPTLSDQTTILETPEYENYDTDIGSNQSSLTGSEDPKKQHMLNSHKLSQSKIAEQVAEMALQAQQLATQKLASTLTPGESIEYTTPSTSGVIAHLDSDNMFEGLNIEMPSTTTSLTIPDGNIFDDVVGENGTAILSAMATKLDINTYVDSGLNLGEGTQFLNVDLMDEFGNAKELKFSQEPLKMVIERAKRPGFPKMTFNETDLQIPDWNQLYYTQLNVTRDQSSIHLEVEQLEDKDLQIMVVVKKGSVAKIKSDQCDDVIFLPKSLDPNDRSEGKMRYMMDNNKVNDFKGRVWFGFRPMPKGFDAKKINGCADLDSLDLGKTKNEIKMKLGIFTFTSGCYFYDHDKKAWASQGCTVGAETNFSQTTCYCNHLTTFAGGWSVAPNVIDWNFVFSNAEFYKNPTVYVTEIVIAVVYLLAVIWARRSDRKDLEKLGVTPLTDNDPRDKYYYEIVTITGIRRNAGTDSKVFVILSGEEDETDVRMLSDEKRKIFRRGGVDTFLMAVPERLGALNYARVWHDNSGKGKFGSWYMKYMIVRDVQTEEKWIFICNRWFAVEEDDGQVDRVVPVAGLAQMTEFGHLFSERSRKNLVDGHLWFSVVARPPQSRFTRVQRVSCCLCLLYATMLANAMFYQRQSDDTGTAFTFGPFALSPQQIYIGIISNLIVFPANFVVIMLFRKSRARKKRPSRLDEALKKVPSKSSASVSDVQPDVTGIWSIGGKGMSQGQPRPGSSFSQCEDRPDSRGDRRRKKKKMELPWFCRYLGWLLLWVVTLGSAAMVTFYGISFQDDKCKKWITSMLVAFFTSIFVTQPVKVFLTAIFFSLIWKNPGDEEDEHPEDEEEPSLAKDEELMHTQTNTYGAARPRKIGYKPPDPTELERARIQRLNEIKMWDIIREIVFYSFFLWILMVISYRNRSPNGYFYKDSLEKMVIKNNDTLQWFTTISNTEEFWLWARSGLVNSLRASNYYNKDPPLLLRGFIGDKVSRIMGFATMRQLRVKQGLCNTIDVMATTILECNEDYSMFNEEKMSFGPGWSPTIDQLRREYTYTPASELNGFPYWGRLGVYGGGGYVVQLRGSKQTLEKGFLTLESEKWIDKYTRAVFVEFTVYNPQVNLFAIATIIAEFQSSGGVVGSYRFEPAMLLPYMTSVMLFQVICEIIYFCFTIVFIVKEFRNFVRQRSKYFKSFWNLIELSIIIMSVSAIVVYFYRLIVTNSLTSEFKRNHGNEYMKFQYVGYWNELFSYMIGWLVFFGSLKFLKLLRFNKRMSLLGSTLKNGAHSILHFSLMFWIVFLAFMQLFYLTFMTISPAFSTFIKAAESGILMMMGKFDIYGMLMVEPILTQVYVFFFVVTVTFILVNMFLSILNETFGSVRVDINKQNNDYEIVDFMVNRFKRWVGFGSIATTLPPTTATSDTSRTSFSKDTVEEFPDRIDRLLNSISNVYMDENIEALIESNGESKKLAMKHMMKGPGDFTEDGPTKVHTH